MTAFVEANVHINTAECTPFLFPLHLSTHFCSNKTISPVETRFSLTISQDDSEPLEESFGSYHRLPSTKVPLS